MSFPEYPVYKDSGIPWLRQMPHEWVKSYLKYVADINMGQSPASDDCNADGIGTPFLQGNGEFGSKYPSAKQFCPVAKKLADVGDILFSVRAPVGALNQADRIYGIGRGLCAVKASEGISKNFLWWFLSSSRELLDSISTGSTFEAVSAEQVENMALVLPSSLEEQTQIARFLDHETAKIDSLIEQQQRLIELLKEKRQAVISNAVTKGLDPTVPMKDSGVEWLGEVPVHWGVSKFGYLSRVVRGGSPRPAGDPELFNGDYSPWVTVAEITKDDEVYLAETETCLTKKGSDQCRVFRAGTLLISNSGATLGVPKILSIDANANDGVVGFEDMSLNHEFAYFFINTQTETLRDRVKQGSGQPNLNTDIVKAIEVPVPPLDESDLIVSYVNNIKDQFKLLTEQASTAVQLLNERRSALISAAVTGKIDVRNWQPPASGKELDTQQEFAHG